MKKIKSKVVFQNKKIFSAYKKLEKGDNLNKKLYKWISRAVDDLKKDAFSGILISEKQVPKSYKKIFKDKRMWKYNLPNAYRLIYTIETDRIEIFSIILEWFDHKDYDKRFKY
jgi:mRNA-degrading endonuclease RelE of RelBE toxin-antitoxin system